MKKVICSNEQLRCYPVGECPLKDRCMWYQAAQPGEVLESSRKLRCWQVSMQSKGVRHEYK